MIEEKEDFFEQTPDDEPPKEKKPKEPRLQPDDPLYYDREEGRWEHLTPAPYNRWPLLWGAVGIVALVCLLVCFYIYFFTAKVDYASQYGYIDDIHKEGTMFQTFEGVLLPYKNLKDTTRVYDGDFIFSMRDDSLATQLKYTQGTGRPVRLDYKVYRVRLPWRGNTKTLVTGVDTAIDPGVLLPPDRRPERP